MKLGLISKIAMMAGKNALRLRKVAPSLMVYGGIAGVVTSTVLFVKKGDEGARIINAHKNIMEKLEETGASKSEMRREKLSTLLDLGRTYGLPITIMAGSIAAIIGGHNLMRKEVLGLMAVNTALEARHSRLLKRVTDEVGDEKAKEWESGIYEKEIDVEDEKGNKTKEKIKETDREHTLVDEIIFDESSRAYTKSGLHNHMFLINIEKELTEKLQRKGYLFLAEALEELELFDDIKLLGEAAFRFGWLLGKGENKVDFHLELNDRAIRGLEPVWILRMNHDGDIMNDINWKNIWPIRKRSYEV